jgi:hypothetical protein
MVNWLVVLAVAVLTIVVLAIRDHLRYVKQRAWLPGPRWVPPFIGNVISMVMGPVEFYRKMASHKYAANNLIGKYVNSRDIIILQS